MSGPDRDKAEDFCGVGPLSCGVGVEAPVVAKAQKMTVGFTVVEVVDEGILREAWNEAAGKTAPRGHEGPGMKGDGALWFVHGSHDRGSQPIAHRIFQQVDSTVKHRSNIFSRSVRMIDCRQRGEC